MRLILVALLLLSVPVFAQKNPVVYSGEKWELLMSVPFKPNCTLKSIRLNFMGDPEGYEYSAYGGINCKENSTLPVTGVALVETNGGDLFLVLSLYAIDTVLYCELPFDTLSKNNCTISATANDAVVGEFSMIYTP